MPRDKDQFTLTRKELIENLRREVGSYTAAKQAVTTYFEEVERALVEEGMVKLQNFGRFETSHKRERVGRNPRNGEEKVISARTVVKFRPCNKLRNAVRTKVSVDDGNDG